MRKLYVAAGILLVLLAVAEAVSAQTRLRERCTANRCVYYEPGQGRVASVSRDRTGRVVIQRPSYRGGGRTVISRDGRISRGTYRTQRTRR